jgi:UDP-N-acetylmuramoyl-L-alanyl-D-glutamate--2,6-diaminopimelate ligase
MKLTELLQGLEVIEKQGDAEISGLCVDSRQVQPGDAFIALVGGKQDGHAYLKQAFEREASVLIVSKRESLSPAIGGPKSEIRNSPAWAIVPDTREALWRMAQRFYGDPTRDLLTIGITGTNGKSTTTHLLQAVLNDAGYPAALLGTLGYHFGQQHRQMNFTTPEVYQLQALLAEAKAAGARAAVMEVSSHALVQKRVDGVRFDGGVFTNLTQEHLDFHGTMEAYSEAKLRFFTELAAQGGKEFRSVINLDAEWGRWFAERARGRVLTYGTNEEADIRAVDVEISLSGIRFTVLNKSEQPFPVQLQLSAPFNLANGLAAAAAALSLNLPVEAIQNGLASVQHVLGRFERVPVEREYEVIVDYAHTPDAFQNLLMAARALKPARLVILFGCGGDRDPTKRPLMGRIAAELADRVILTADNPRTEDLQKILEQILTGIPQELRSRVEIEHDRSDAVRLAIQTARPGDLILLVGKGHETYQIIGHKKFPFDDRIAVREALDSDME